MGALDLAVGSGEGLERLLTRLFAEEKFEEEKRRNRVDEDLERQKIHATSMDRKMAMENARDAKSAADQQRENDRIARVIALRPIGSVVTEEEVKRETAAGVPEAVYDRQLPQVGSKAISAVGDDDPTKRPQIRTERQSQSKPAQTIFKGTQNQLHSQERITNLEEQRNTSNAQRDRALDRADHAERRITGYGSPTVVIYDPNSPTGNRVVPRGSEEVQSGNASGPAAATQTARLNAYKRTIGLIDKLLANKVEDFGPALGAFDATVGAKANEFLPVKVKDWLGPNLTGGGQRGDELRSTMEALRAFTSFDEGGKQFTGTEKELLESFLQNVKSQPEVALQRLKLARDRAQATLDQLSGSGGSRIRAIRPAQSQGAR